MGTVGLILPKIYFCTSNFTSIIYHRLIYHLKFLLNTIWVSIGIFVFWFWNYIDGAWRYWAAPHSANSRVIELDFGFLFYFPWRLIFQPWIFSWSIHFGLSLSVTYCFNNVYCFYIFKRYKIKKGIWFCPLCGAERKIFYLF